MIRNVKVYKYVTKKIILYHNSQLIYRQKKILKTAQKKSSRNYQFKTGLRTRLKDVQGSPPPLWPE